MQNNSNQEILLGEIRFETTKKLSENEIETYIKDIEGAVKETIEEKKQHGISLSSNEKIIAKLGTPNQQTLGGPELLENVIEVYIVVQNQPTPFWQLVFASALGTALGKLFLDMVASKALASKTRVILNTISTVIRKKNK